MQQIYTMGFPDRNKPFAGYEKYYGRNEWHRNMTAFNPMGLRSIDTPAKVEEDTVNE